MSRRISLYLVSEIEFVMGWTSAGLKFLFSILNEVYSTSPMCHLLSQMTFFSAKCMKKELAMHINNIKRNGGTIFTSLPGGRLVSYYF